jgi:hypothetical protein
MAIIWGDARHERPMNVEHTGMAIETILEALRGMEVRLRAALEAQRDDARQSLAEVRERLERIEDSVEEIRE